MTKCEREAVHTGVKSTRNWFLAFTMRRGQALRLQRRGGGGGPLGAFATRVLKPYPEKKKQWPDDTGGGTENLESSLRGGSNSTGKKGEKGKSRMNKQPNKKKLPIVRAFLGRKKKKRVEGSLDSTDGGPLSTRRGGGQKQRLGTREKGGSGGGLNGRVQKGKKKPWTGTIGSLIGVGGRGSEVLSGEKKVGEDKFRRRTRGESWGTDLWIGQGEGDAFGHKGEDSVDPRVNGKKAPSKQTTTGIKRTIQPE